jgi:hypothetical protein
MDRVRPEGNDPRNETVTRNKPEARENGKEMLLWLLGPLVIIALLLAFVFAFLREDSGAEDASRAAGKAALATMLPDRSSGSLGTRSYQVSWTAPRFS